MRHELTDDEILQLWGHHQEQAERSYDFKAQSDLRSQDADIDNAAVLLLARDIERRERAKCADEIEEGHEQMHSGVNCDCQHLSRLLRAREHKEVRTHILNRHAQKVVADASKDWELKQDVAVERARCLAVAELSIEQGWAPESLTARIQSGWEPPEKPPA